MITDTLPLSSPVEGEEAQIQFVPINPSGQQFYYHCVALVTSSACAEKIRTAIPQANLNYLSIYVADARGFFRDEGLENETVVISGPFPSPLCSAATSIIAGPAAAACAPR